jgi:hypothetical protein
VSQLTLRVPTGWEPRSQTLSVQTSTDGSTFSTASAAAARTFDPAVTITLTPVTARYVRLTVTGNTGWPAAQLSALEVYGGDAPPVPPAVSDLARGKPASASSHTQSYVAGSLVDGNQGSYWESANSAFPQWVQVDLGAATTVGRVILRLPPGWERRTETLAVTGSTNGSTFTTLSGSAARTFDPATGNQVTLSFAATATRYLRVTVTGNTAWPAAQLSTLEAYAS